MEVSRPGRVTPIGHAPWPGHVSAPVTAEPDPQPFLGRAEGTVCGSGRQSQEERVSSQGLSSQ